jgi:hypothetical protein
LPAGTAQRYSVFWHQSYFAKLKNFFEVKDSWACMQTSICLFVCLFFFLFISCSSCFPPDLFLTYSAHVQPHRQHLLSISENVWVIETIFAVQPEVVVSRTMTVYRMRNGKLWIHSLCCLLVEVRIHFISLFSFVFV